MKMYKDKGFEIILRNERNYFISECGYNDCREVNDIYNLFCDIITEFEVVKTGEGQYIGNCVLKKEVLKKYKYDCKLLEKKMREYFDMFFSLFIYAFMKDDILRFNKIELKETEKNIAIRLEYEVCYEYKQ